MARTLVCARCDKPFARVQQGAIIIDLIHPGGRPHVNVITLEQLDSLGDDPLKLRCARCPQRFARIQQDSILIDATHYGNLHTNVITREQLRELMVACLPEREPRPA